MSFDIHTPRETNGQFAEKTGGAAEISLAAPVPVAEAVDEFRSTLSQVGFGDQRDFDLRKDVLEGRKTGNPHMYDHHYEDMWQGRAVNVLGGQDGWSKTEVEKRMATIDRLQEDLAEERVQPGDFGYGPTFNRGDIRKYLKATRVELEAALATEGRCLVKNAKGARQRYADFEGGGNRR